MRKENRCFYKYGQQNLVMTSKTNCEYCMNYCYDEYYECYVCDIDLDEDEMEKFVTNTFQDCPYFRYGDEYRIVRKQM